MRSPLFFHRKVAMEDHTQFLKADRGLKLFAEHLKIPFFLF